MSSPYNVETGAGTPRRPRRTKRPSPRRGLALLIVVFLALVAGIGASTQWGHPKGSWTPKMGLDLEGGRRVVLQPVLTGHGSISDSEVKQAVDIIRNRVDATGTAEAEVTTLGANNIVVSIPGNPSQQVLDSLARSSQLNFRAVIATSPAAAGKGSAGATGTGSAATNSGAGAGSASGSAKTSQPSTSSSGNGAQATTSGGKASGGAASAKPSASATSTGSRDLMPSVYANAAPSNGSDPNWGKQQVSNQWVSSHIVPAGSTYNQLLAKFACTPTDQQYAANIPNSQPSVMCSTDRSTKYLMGPVEVSGSQITDAASGPATNQQGNTTGGTQVTLNLNGKGKSEFAGVTKRLAKLSGDRNRFAITVDGQVIEAPGVNEPILDGNAVITGGFTATSGKLLADSLKFGALPVSFKELTSDQESPQLGSNQLHMGLLAGLIGFALVILYSLIQYRALGLVTIASLVVAAGLTYLAVTLLGTLMDFRLSMAGVTGLIVAIGITADSFIVYFERVRDEVRMGRPLRAAVETGWTRAQRTIIISDLVNFLAAAILYILSESTVKAFAFTLGLTTLIDLAVVMLFTHPTLSLLARTKFFGGGHPASGLDPSRLGGRGAFYAGRGRTTISDRRRAASQEGSL